METEDRYVHETIHFLIHCPRDPTLFAMPWCWRSYQTKPNPRMPCGCFFSFAM